MDSRQYRDERERECAEVSASCDELSVADAVGPGELPRAQLIGRAHLTADAFVQMYEIVELHDNHVHRVKYAYYLFVGGQEIGGYERDPVHDDQPEHFHCTHRDRGHRPGGEPSAAVSFKEAVARAWEWLSEHGYETSG